MPPAQGSQLARQVTEGPDDVIGPVDTSSGPSNCTLCIEPQAVLNAESASGKRELMSLSVRSPSRTWSPRAFMRWWAS